MQKILFVSGSLAQNGTEMFMMNVLRHIDRSKFHIDFYISDNEVTPNRIEAEELGSQVFIFSSRRDNVFKYLLSQWRFLKSHAHEYDVVHWNGGNLSSFIGFILYWYYGIPIRIVHAHSSCAVGIHNKILHRFHRLFISTFCTHFFACSSEAARFFFRSNPAIIINNGIDVNKFCYVDAIRKETRLELGIAYDDIVIGHVGRFDDNKNHLFLLGIFESFLKLHPKSRLLLVGDGETYNTIKDKVDSLCLSNKIIMTGSRNDVSRMMQAMDCFVMPSKFEGLPFVLVEAQCSGLPCIISDTINVDVDLTGLVKFVSLSDGTTKWVKIIENTLQKSERKSRTEQISEKGFSIADTVMYLQEVYSSF